MDERTGKGQQARAWRYFPRCPIGFRLMGIVVSLYQSSYDALRVLMQHPPPPRLGSLTGNESNRPLFMPWRFFVPLSYVLVGDWRLQEYHQKLLLRPRDPLLLRLRAFILLVHTVTRRLSRCGFLFTPEVYILYGSGSLRATVLKLGSLTSSTIRPTTVYGT